MSSNLRVCVIGAGVIGLSTATLLQDFFPSAEITIAADKFLTETTSDGAGGIFRPGGSFSGPTMQQTLKWFEDSYEFYDSFLINSPATAHLAGIKRINGYYLSSEDPDLPKNYFLEKILPDFRMCSADELTEFPLAKYGSFFTTLLTECKRYLPYLTEIFKSKGGGLIKWRVNNFEELAKDFDLVFNCSGLGSRKLCNDHRMIPVRGQVFKVEAPWLDHFTYMDYDTYIIPGMDAITLGGTRQFENFKTKIDKNDGEGIMERCTELIPSLKHAKILREWVGFRPYRGTVRVEHEVMHFEGTKSLKVLHNYGHGGYGVMSAPGTSKQAVAMATELLRGGIRAML